MKVTFAPLIAILTAFVLWGGPADAQVRVRGGVRVGVATPRTRVSVAIGRPYYYRPYYRPYYYRPYFYGSFGYGSYGYPPFSWYPYSGDRRAVRTVKAMLDYQLGHGTTPASWAWSRVPFATSCAGARRYGGCLAGMPRRFYGGGEPDKVGLLGLGYLRFYELTGDRRYLRAAVSAASALA